MFLWFAIPVGIYSIQNMALSQNVTERLHFLATGNTQSTVTFAFEYLAYVIALKEE
jgi:hypothetical protein